MTKPTLRALLQAVALAVFAAGAQAQTVQDPETVVSELLAAMQDNDGDRIRAVFAEDARQAYGNRAPQSGEDFRDWLTSDIIEPHGRVENAELSVDGNAVVVTGRYRNDNGYSSDADFLMEVHDGEIVSWQMRY